MTSPVVPTGYKNLLKAVKARVLSAQYEALKSVNKELVSLYWDIGQLIMERQKDRNWGKAVVERLSDDLQSEFPGIAGFSTRNIWYMRDFFHVYAGKSKLQPLVAEINWTHNIVILNKCKSDLEREFYIRMARKMGWSKNVLIHQIENKTYEKTLSGQTNFDRTLPSAVRRKARLSIRDEYTFDFLELGGEHDERDLERALIARIEHFLRAMGGQFAFIGSQYRLEVDEKEYFIDLLLYHRPLKSLVAVNSPTRRGLRG